MRSPVDSEIVGVAPERFVGRLEELTTVAASVDRTVSGQAQIVWIEGEAGSGKTGLLNAALERLPAGFRVLRAEADELARDVDLELVGQFGPLRATDGFGVGLELLDLFDKAQVSGPLAVIAEDVHWADDLSRQALLTVARRLREDFVIMLITSRPVPRHDGWARLVADPKKCVRIALGALSVNDVAELARHSGAPLDRHNADRLHRHTRGHALYVRTLLRELTPEQLTSAEEDLPAPRSLASATAAGIADLPSAAQSLATAMAVVNRRLPLSLVATMAGVSEPERALEPLLKTGFVVWWPMAVGTHVEYTHPLWRAAVYADLSPTRRRELHLAAAAVLDPETALVHRVAAASVGDEAVAVDLVDAAARKADQGKLGLAARDLLWASSVSLDSDRIEDALLRATQLLLADGQVRRAALLRDQLAALRPRPLRSLLLGTLAWEEGDARSAERWLTDAAILAERSNFFQIRILALIQLATLYVTQSRGAEAFDSASQALALGPEDTATDVRAWCELAKAEGFLHGPSASLELLDRRLAVDPYSIAPAETDLLIIRGTMSFYAGRTHQAIADLRTALQLARQGAPATQLSRAHLQLAQLLIVAGQWDDALIHARLGISVVEDEGHVWLEAQAHAALASIQAARGEWDSAAIHVGLARSVADAKGSAEAVFTVHIAESAIARARADSVAVINALSPLIGTGASAAIPMNSSLGWWPVAIHAHIDVGDLAEASRQIHQLRSAAGDRGLDFGARLLGLEARILKARSELDRAGAAFAAALSALGPNEALLDRALLHHEHGRLLLARRQRQEAVTQLTLAHGLLSAVKATPYQRHVEQDLESCGLRSEPSRSRSPLGLTEREQDVAALVANGMTNREVAAQLYISSKAVEYHLRNIFGKLGISSRHDLLAALSS